MFYLDSQDTTIGLDIKKTSGREVCFIFDGLDEYIENNRENIVKKLIYKEILPQAMVIAASCPISTANHRRIAPVDVRIEGLEFTRSASQCIAHVLFTCACFYDLLSVQDIRRQHSKYRNQNLQLFHELQLCEKIREGRIKLRNDFTK